MALTDAWDILQLAGAHHSEHIAYVDADSQQIVTYSQLHQQSTRLASWLHSQGVQRGDRIAVVLHNCIEAIHLHFAAAALHAIVVNVNTHWVDREINLVLQDSSPQLVFVHPQYLASVEAALESPVDISGPQPASPYSVKNCPG